MSTVELSIQKGIAKVVMNRPDVRNAFSPEMIQELKSAFVQIQKDHSVRVVHFTGSGKVFCAGADLNYMKEIVKFGFAQNKQDAKALAEMFETIYACDVPVVAEVRGAAFGGALGLIAVSDLVVAEVGTQYCFSEVKLGIAPAVISDFVLRKVPKGLVQNWMLSGQVFDSKVAEKLGLVHQVVAESEMAATVCASLESYFAAAPMAARETKKLLREIRPGTVEALELTTDLIASRRASPEGQEGLGSFLEKREPSWRKK